MAEPAKFDHEVLIKSLQEVKDTIPSINADAFCQTMLEYVKIFDSMGSGLQMAFKDITQKVGRIRRNYATMSHVQGGIMDFIKWEQSEKIHVLNGENPKMAPDPKYAEYESTARTVLRLMWFLDFVSSLVGQLETNRKISVSDACKKAYDTALGPHHPFAIRMAAKTAMTFAPGRSKLLGGLFPKEYTEDDKYAVIRKMMELVEPIRLFLWGYFEKNDMVKLP